MISAMKQLALLLASGALVSATEGPSGAAVTKVIAMLSTMEATSKKEKQEEEVAFAKFNMWCTEESKALNKAISQSAAEIESLTASIDKMASDAKTLADEIAKHQADIEASEKDMKSETEQRKKENADFLAEEKDYSESVDAIDRALVILNKQNYDRPADADSLLQLTDQPGIPQKARAIVAAFMSMMDEPEAEGRELAPTGVEPTGAELNYTAPKANAYEFQSDGVINLLKKLQDEFRTKLGECQKAEMNSKHAFNMVVEDLTDLVANSKKAISEKTKTKAMKEEKKAEDSKQLQATEIVKADDEKVLAEMTAECTQKKESFDEKQQLRAEEIEAIQKAIEVMKSPEVSANAEKYLTVGSLAQTGATSLVQKSTSTMQGVHRRIRSFLESEGQRLHSKNIALLVEKMNADPFAKVKTMIDSMITRLLEEANADADHEGFCDTEMGKSKITRNKLSEDIDGLQASIDEGKSTIAELTKLITELGEQLATLQKTMGEAADIRREEKATNEATIMDSKAGQAAVEAAIAVLKEFYKGAGTATALLQVPTMGGDEWDSLANPDFEGTIDKGHKEGMQTFGKKFTAQQDEAGGVLALMDVILSDFSTLEADTLSAETESVASYDEFVTESKKTKATKTKQVEMDEADKDKANVRLQSDIKDLKATQDELLAADRYYEKLVPQCVDQGMTWEERVAAREAEIKSLKEALSILGSQGSVA